LRRANRSLTRATRALLLPWLLIAARDQPSGLRGRIPLALIGEIRLHRLVHDGHVHRAIEQLGRQRDRVTLGSV
jgi:hypothetical protein